MLCINWQTLFHGAGKERWRGHFIAVKLLSVVKNSSENFNYDVRHVYVNWCASYMRINAHRQSNFFLFVSLSSYLSACLHNFVIWSQRNKRNAAAAPLLVQRNFSRMLKSAIRSFFWKGLRKNL